MFINGLKSSPCHLGDVLPFDGCECLACHNVPKRTQMRTFSFSFAACFIEYTPKSGKQLISSQPHHAVTDTNLLSSVAVWLDSDGFQTD